jgi:hypothetical protein
VRAVRQLRVSVGGGERLELCVGAHESAYSSATTRSNSPVDTSQLLSQEAGEAYLLRLRDTDREHRVKVCVLAPLTRCIIEPFHLEYQ